MFAAAEDHDHGINGSGLDHGGLSGLLDDDHTQYALLVGRAGSANDLILSTTTQGQLAGSSASGQNLKLTSSTHATKSKILFGTSAYDEVENRLGIGLATPETTIDVLSVGQQGQIRIVTEQNAVSQESSFKGTCYSFAELNGGAEFVGHAIRGTRASPSATGAGDVLVSLGGGGFTDDTGPTLYASIVIEAVSLWSSFNAETQFRFFTTPNASVTPAERFRIGSAGQFGIGGATYGTAGQVFTSGGSAAAPTWSTPAAGGSETAHPFLLMGA